MKIVLGFILSICFALSYSQELDTINAQKVILKNGEIRWYPKPKLKEMITRLPKDFMTTNRDFFAKDHAYYTVGSIVATAMMVPFDQKVVDAARSFANKLGMSPNNEYAKVAPIPKNLGAGLYLIGNGITVMLLSAGFYSFGILKNDYRAKATANGLLESLALSGVYVQVLKRSIGRESPFIAIQNGHPGGNWSPFPSFAAYQKNTPLYDAIPSGHLATIMSGFTVVAENYPDVKWLKPVGYSLMGLMCLQMMQSQVHWLSDYPIALIIGYFTGKSIARNRFFTTKKISDNRKYKIEFASGNVLGITTAGIKIKF